MTPEQFVYWLCGYLTDTNDHDDFLIKRIRAALEKIRVTNDSGDIVAVFGGDSP